MSIPIVTDPPTDPAVDPDADPIEDPQEPAEDPDAPIDGEEALGDPGKRAIATIKTKYKSERALRLEAERKLAAATAPKPDELTPDQIREQIRAEVRAEANQQIVSARVETVATRLLHNPADAAAFLDLTEFEVDAKGRVDADEIESAIKDLIAERPYLAINSVPAQGGNKRRIPEVPADPANKQSIPVSHADKIKAAQAAGDFATVIALQTELLDKQ